jgi:hypothetical protein
MSGFGYARRPAGVWQPPAPADFYRRRRERRGRHARSTTRGPCPPTLAAVADADNFLRVFHDLRRRAGRAPGPDGLTYADLGRGEAAGVLRDLARAVRDGTYRPGPGRRVSVPKGHGQGRRTLTLRGVCDRVVAAALNGALTPFWEGVFLPGSMGFRPGRGAWRLLAALEATVVGRGLWALAVDDVRRAFDSVRVDDALEDHRRHLRDEGLLGLVAAVLGGHAGRAVGIDQGCPYSPTALNVRLHFAHDLGLSRGPTNPPWLRYADNLAYACRDVTEGRQALDLARHTLGQAGFLLKEEDGPPADLRRGDEAQLLGFTLRHDRGRLACGLGKDAWEGLGQALDEAHGADDPPAAARAVVLGWVSAQGPAFEDLRAIGPGRALDTAAAHGFREITSPGELSERLAASYDRWCGLRREAYQGEGVPWGARSPRA